MMLFLLAAALRGLKLSIEPVPVLMTLIVIGALLVAYRRQKGAQGGVRLATAPATWSGYQRGPGRRIDLPGRANLRLDTSSTRCSIAATR